ncbi:MAG: hypothetical protein LBK61_00020 [Spirochaetaceae bacterium]|jgi:hypothetical protein|nr:hypothetical protein [Spirochaetaceae bacterium]
MDMKTEQTGITSEDCSSFDDMLDVLCGLLREKQAEIFLRRISALEETLSGLEESLVANLKTHGEESTP